MKNEWLNSKEWRLVDKDGEIVYKTGTKDEVADYALRNQLMFLEEEAA